MPTRAAQVGQRPPGQSQAAPIPASDLREPGRILLLSCYELGHQPLGVAWPAAFLEAAGFRPGVQDLSAQPLDEEAVRRAALVALSVPMHTALVLAMPVAARVRALNPGAHLCFHGLYAQLNREYLLAGVADSVLGAEAEPALVKLAQQLECGAAGAAPESAAAGASTAHSLERTRFPPSQRNQLPPLTSYVRLAELDRAGLPVERAVGYVEASRGCKHGCRHCPIPPVYQRRFVIVDAHVVHQEIAARVAEGAQHITFGDPDFLNGPGHALKVLRRMHAEFPALTFDFTTKVEHILRHSDLFPELRALGGRFVVSALESLSDTVLAHLDKGHTRKDAQAALRIVSAAGLVLRPTFVAFTPWTTLRDYLDLLDFVGRNGLVHHVDPVQFTLRLLAPPGSWLLRLPDGAPGPLAAIDGEMDAPGFQYRWRHPDPRMDLLQAQVSALVEAAAGNDTPPEQTFAALLRAAWLHAGQLEQATQRLAAWPPSAPAPRLTEPWFC